MAKITKAVRINEKHIEELEITATSFITLQAPLADTTPVLRQQKKWRG
jgi:hypothetical protein